MSKTALIAGASGMVGKFCLSYLLMDPAYDKVIALVRRELPLKDNRLEQIVIDFDRIEEHLSTVRADDVYCCLGTTIKDAGSQERFRQVDYDYPVRLARSALQNGAQQFLVVSSMGADPGSSLFYNRVKGEMEKAIEHTGYSSLHIFRPSILRGMRPVFRLGERVALSVMGSLSWLMIGPLKKYRPIDVMVVAHAMVTKAKEQKPGIHHYSSDQIQQFFDERVK